MNAITTKERLTRDVLVTQGFSDNYIEFMLEGVRTDALFNELWDKKETIGRQFDVDREILNDNMSPRAMAALLVDHYTNSDFEGISLLYSYSNTGLKVLVFPTERGPMALVENPIDACAKDAMGYTLYAACCNGLLSINDCLRAINAA